MATATETVPTPTPATEEDTNAASKKDEIKNEYISILNKKLRSIAKKAARLTDIEKKVEQGAQINDEQQSILANKDNINKSLKDYEDLRAQFMKVHQQEEKIQKRQQKRKTEAKTETDKDKSNQEKDQLTTLVRLFHSASFFESVTPEGRKKFFAENEEAARGSGKKPSLTESDVHALNQLFNLIVKKKEADSDSKSSVEQSVEQALRFISQSDKEFLNGLTYKRVYDQVNEFHSHHHQPATPASTPVVEAKPVETPVVHETKKEEHVQHAAPAETNHVHHETEQNQPQPIVEENASNEVEGSGEEGFSQSARRPYGGRGRGSRGGRRGGRGGSYSGGEGTWETKEKRGGAAGAGGERGGRGRGARRGGNRGGQQGAPQQQPTK